MQGWATPHYPLVSIHLVLSLSADILLSLSQCLSSSPHFTFTPFFSIFAHAPLPFIPESLSVLQLDWIWKDCSPRNSSSSFPSSSPSLSLSDESAGTEDRAEMDSCLGGRNWKEYYGLSQELPTISIPTQAVLQPYLHIHSAGCLNSTKQPLL